MLTRILHNSPKLCKFFNQLQLNLSEPQTGHMLNMADALLVCEETKTLAALQRQLVYTPDSSNMADFLRISPWKANDVRAVLHKHQMQWLKKAAEQTGKDCKVFVNIDDSLGEKDKNTKYIEPVAWYHDHNESSKRKPKYKNGFCFLVCTVRIGDYVATFDVRLYLREKTVRYINKSMPPEERLRFRSKSSIARQILADLKPLLPNGQVYIQFDSWYASKKLIKYAHRQGWRVTCTLKRSRTLNKMKLSEHELAIRHKWYNKVSVTTTDGSRTYYVRQLKGCLADIKEEVRVYFSKRHHRAKALSYILSTDIGCSAKEVLQGYSWRWSVEVVNFYLKCSLGLSDFRVRSYEAVDKYMVVVHLAWAYVEQRYAEEGFKSKNKCYGDVIRQHKDEHAEKWLSGAINMAMSTGDKEEVLKLFLRLESKTA